MPNNVLQAVIFDLDGVVADSHPIHEQAWKSLLVEQGLDPETIDLGFLYAGHQRRAILRHYLGSLDETEVEILGKRKDELYGQASESVTMKPGLFTVLEELDAAGIPFALATSAGKSRSIETLQKFGIAHRFAVVVTGADVQAAKPHPEIFLTVAKKMGIRPRNALVIEDSVAGVKGAVAAGMTCIGYTTANRVDELREAGAHDVVTEFPRAAAAYFHRLVQYGTRDAGMRPIDADPVL
ncbi:MAG TPA: HAD family phosphatase [Terriglobales bacterium]|nr:HAD family phosphatase [Terriglobales bacterium]